MTLWMVAIVPSMVLCGAFMGSFLRQISKEAQTQVMPISLEFYTNVIMESLERPLKFWEWPQKQLITCEPLKPLRWKKVRAGKQLFFSSRFNFFLGI